MFENLGSKCEDPLKIFIEIFFLYMYAFSIIWMCFMSLMFSAATETEKTNFFMKSFKKVNFLNSFSFKFLILKKN